MTEPFRGPLERAGECIWRIPRSYRPGMRVDGLVFADDALAASIRNDQAAEQVANVACLPGIQVASFAMPDIHWGYGFCIGGVCATDPDEGGVVSPGGVGYDVNCGVRLLRTDLRWDDDVRPRLRDLVDDLYRTIPAGVGETGRWRFDRKALRRLLADGVPELRRQGLATQADVEHAEAGGCVEGADPDEVSDRAVERGAGQCGTLGSGNHFAEIDVVDTVHDARAARAFGLEEGAVCVALHSGSRGLGYQVCDDALRMLRDVPAREGIALPDRQLACARVHSREGARYLGAMRAAANFAWCNRQLLSMLARESFERVLGRPWESLGMTLVYDVAHNIAQMETHEVGGRPRRLCVHRKGATRAFPPGHPELPEAYRDVGQPVIVPGDMGRASWVLRGTEESMRLAFGTTCHGAGRRLSRTAAAKLARARSVQDDLERRGVLARARGWKGLAEEQPDAYKDVDAVVEVCDRAGLARKVARLRPVGVVKG